MGLDGIQLKSLQIIMSFDGPGVSSETVGKNHYRQHTSRISFSVIQPEISVLFEKTRRLAPMRR